MKSLEIDEKINRMVWCPRVGRSISLLTTNGMQLILCHLIEYFQLIRSLRLDKTVKLYRLNERRIHKIGDMNGVSNSLTSLKIPTLATYDTVVYSSCRREFANAHAYHVNAISLNSDKETFISADDLRINLWHLEVPDQSFSTFFGRHRREFPF